MIGHPQARSVRFRRRRYGPAPGRAVLLALLAGLSVLACGGDSTGEGPAGVATTSQPTPAPSFSVAPGEALVLYRDGLGDIEVLDPGTGERWRKEVDADNEAVIAAECNRDGSQVAYLRQRFEHTYRELVIAGPGAPPEPIRLEGLVQGMAWSPDGERMALIAYQPQEGYRLSILEIASGRASVVASGPDFASRPAWSPDGRRIAFHGRTPDQRNQIYVFDVASGSEPTRLTDNQSEVYDPDWSPDGASLLVSGQDADRVFQIYRVDAESGAQQKLTTSPLFKIRPRQSPDGKLIAFGGSTTSPAVSRVAVVRHQFGLFLMISDGSGETALTVDPRLNPSGPDPYLDAFLQGWCLHGPWLDSSWAKQ